MTLCYPARRQKELNRVMYLLYVSSTTIIITITSSTNTTFAMGRVNLCIYPRPL